MSFKWAHPSQRYLEVLRGRKQGSPIKEDEDNNEDIVLRADKYVTAYTKIQAGERVPQMLFNIDGSAGCAKTYLIHAICQQLHAMATAAHGKPDPIRVLAPSSAAAFNIRGRTAHSALGLPVNCAFVPLTGP
jgi:hypothetical protein